jgi:hypothetical protein
MSSTEKKTITINPELFKLSSGKTKKSKPTEKGEIKMKSAQLSQAKTNTLKRKILKVIRAKQQDEYKRLFSKPVSEKVEKINDDLENNKEFNKEFNKSLEYLSDLEQKIQKGNEDIHSVKNHTFRNYSLPVEPIVSNELPQIFTQIQSQNISEIGEPSDIKIQIQPSKHVFSPHPGYGCLKGGSMPTYRTIKNKEGMVQYVPVYKEKEEKEEKEPSVESIPNKEEELDSQKMKDKLNILTLKTHTNLDDNYKKIKNIKRRKIYKRTYRVGKSKNKIGCLISNKTIRQKIQQSVYDLKHTNIKDVRKFLLKRGFIKVGTTAPNDVLRKMYESVAMVCGEVQNHNPDNLLYNFINDDAT